VVNGELHAAHVLYGLVYGVQLGIGGPQKDMAVLMTLNHNGQGITLANQLKEKGVKDGASLKRLLDNENRDYTSPRPSPPALMPCGCITGWLRTASIPSRM